MPPPPSSLIQESWLQVAVEISQCQGGVIVRYEQEGGLGGKTYWNLPSPSSSSTALQIASWASRHIFSNLALIAVLAVPSLQRESGTASTACEDGVD